MITEIVATNIIVAVVETVVRFSPAPIMNCPFYVMSTHTNIVRVVEQNIEEKMCVGRSLTCVHCRKPYVLTPRLLYESQLASLYMDVCCPHCDRNEGIAETNNKIDLTKVSTVCSECAKAAGCKPKNGAFGVWLGTCGICKERKICMDLWHEWIVPKKEK